MPAKAPVRKRVTAKKAPAKRVPKIKIIGKATHYYDRIGVAIIELTSPLKTGDTVIFKHAEHEHIQPIHSMQINHVEVEKAKKGDIVGVKTDIEIHEGAMVIPG
jgi:hypothetical protein